MDPTITLAGARPSTALVGPISLTVQAGPQVGPFLVHPDRVAVLGRQSQCDINLPDPTVSRAHAGLQCKRGTWFITDRGARSGTRLNGAILEPERPTPVSSGDLLEIGPWRFSVRVGEEIDVLAAPARPSRMAESAGKVETVKSDELLTLAQQRLGLLMDFAGAIHAAGSLDDLAAAAVRTAAGGTGYARCALVRLAGSGDSVTTLAATVGGQPVANGFPVSRSLVRAAAAGEVARLTADPMLAQAHSIVSFGICSALCAPVMVGTSVSAYLYLDNSDGAAPDQADAAAFVAALARLTALAMAELGRKALEKRQLQLDADLAAARLAQQRMMPAPSGRAGALAYAMLSVPGRLVAGDLFEVVEMRDGRVAFFLGDVAGKGVGAAVLMAAAQTQLRAALRGGRPLAEAVGELNRDIAARSHEGEFISLFAGVLDPATGTLEFIDAGHGYWMHRAAGGSFRRVPCSGTLVVGIDPECVYAAESFTIGRGDRIVVFSDGVVEQNGPAAEQFGFEGVLRALEGSGSESEDARRLLESLYDFAQTDALSDDVTIASLRFEPP